jgi:hypothetical protein
MKNLFVARVFISLLLEGKQLNYCVSLLVKFKEPSHNQHSKVRSSPFVAAYCLLYLHCLGSCFDCVDAQLSHTHPGSDSLHF